VKKVRLIILFLIASLLAACGQGSEGDGNSNAGSDNPLYPITRQSIRGDIERASVAVAMATNSSKEKKWAEALTGLEGARKDVDLALTQRAANDRLQSLRPMLEELKASLAQAIEAVENRRPDAEGLITQLQVQVNSIRAQAQVLEPSTQPEQPRQ
jgi:ABC-type transporter Mla subunit MlaD